MKRHLIHTDKHIYYQGDELKLITDQFEILHDNSYELYGDFHIKGLVRDANGVYWLSQSKTVAVKTVSKKPFEFVVIADHSPCFAKDKEQVYHFNKACIAIPGADPESFELLGDPHTYFAKDTHQAYAYSAACVEGLMIFDTLDVASFDAIANSQFATDRDDIYHYSHIVEKANTAKYAELFNPEEACISEYGADACLDRFHKNKQYLFNEFPHIKGWWHPEYEFSDCPDIENITMGYIVNDAIYYTEPIYMAIDDLCCPNLIRLVDKASFIALNQYYAKDKYRAYYKTTTIPDVDVDSFCAVSLELARDNSHHYYSGWRIEGVDYDTFQVLDADSAEDKNGKLFRKRKRIGKYQGYFSPWVR